MLTATANQLNNLVASGGITALTAGDETVLLLEGGTSVSTATVSAQI